MRALFLHISDIHWRLSSDKEAVRFQSLARLLPSHFVERIEAIFFVYGGDFVYSGKREEYDDVWERLTEGEEAVKEAFGNEVRYYSVGVPGNHDCDFGTDQSARDSLLRNQEKSPQLQGAITDIMLAPQGNFFEFLDVLTGRTRDQLWPDVDSRIAWKHTYNIGSEIIQIVCFNSAWLSRLREVKGYLFLPARGVISDDSKVALQISLFHHPLSWLETSNATLVRKRLFESADLIFTGHEHAGAALHAELSSQGNVSLHEALPFIDPHSETEGFSAIFLDTKAGQKVQVDFVWNEDVFYRIRMAPASIPSSRPFP